MKTKGQELKIIGANIQGHNYTTITNKRASPLIG